MRNNTYPNIDMQQSGQRIKQMIATAGYTPKMIQDYLHLSCVQPIYRWYKGLILPSVDHLFMLSKLLHVHMEDFLVKQSAPILLRYDVDWVREERIRKHIVEYYKRLQKDVA